MAQKLEDKVIMPDLVEVKFRISERTRCVMNAFTPAAAEGLLASMMKFSKPKGKAKPQAEGALDRDPSGVEVKTKPKGREPKDPRKSAFGALCLLSGEDLLANYPLVDGDDVTITDYPEDEPHTVADKDLQMVIHKGKPAFRAIAFKRMAEEVVPHIGVENWSVDLTAIQIEREYFEIHYDECWMRCDRVRNTKRNGEEVIDLRFRPEFRRWWMDVDLVIDLRLVTLAQVLTIYEHAGLKVGLGEYRPARGGNWGMFNVAPGSFSAERRVMPVWDLRVK